MSTSSCLRFGAKVAGFFWRSLAIFILIAAVVVQLARELTPIVNQHVDEVNQQLSSLLGRQVQIGEIHSRWEGFRPNLRLKHVKVHGDNAQPQQSMTGSEASSLGFHLTPPPTLHFQYLDVELDILSSLKEWRWVIGNLQLQQAHIRLVQQASGRWNLQGIMPTGNAKTTFFKDPLDVFKLAEQVNIQSVYLHLKMRNGESHQLNLNQVRLEKQDYFHRINADVALNSHKLAHLILESRGDPRGKADGGRNIQGYVEVQQSALKGFPWRSLPEPLQKYLPIAALEQAFGRQSPPLEASFTPSLPASPLSPFLSRVWFSSFHLGDWSFKGDWNFRREDANPNFVELTERRVESRDKIPLDPQKNDVLPQSFSGQFDGAWQQHLNALQTDAAIADSEGKGKKAKKFNKWELSWKEVQLTWQDVSIPLPSGVWQKKQKEMVLHLPTVSLERLSENTQKLLSQPVFEKLQDTLATLSASGNLNHVVLQKEVTPSESQWRFQALAEKVAINPWKGIPGVQALNGWTQGHLGKNGISGQFTFAESPHLFSGSSAKKTPFGLILPKLFSTPMYAIPTSGSIFYQWYPQQQKVRIAGNHIQAQLPRDAEMSGKFQVVAPTKPGVFDGQLELALGFRNIPVRDHVLYTPKTLPDSATNWLAASLGDGVVPEGALLFRGTLTKGAPQLAKQLQLGLATQDLDLAYHQDWPALSDISGRLFIDNKKIHADITQGTLWDTKIQQTAVDLVPNTTTGALLKVQTKAVAPASNLIRMVRGTPLQTHLGNVLGSWQGEGQAEVDLGLEFPLGASSKQPAVKTQLSMKLDLEDLYVSQADLTLDRLSGFIGFDSSKGVTSKDLHGRLWGKKLALMFEPTYDTAGNLSDHLLFLSGNASPKPLRKWLKRPELDFVSGDIPFEGRVRFPADTQPVALSVTSDLQGVEVQAPAPLGKLADTTGKLAMDMSIYPKGKMTLSMNYAPMLNGENEEKRSVLNLRMKSSDEQLQALALGIGQPARLQPNIIHIGGHIELPMHLPVWADWATSYFDALNESGKSNLAKEELINSETADRQVKALPMQFALLLDEVQILGHSFADWSLAGELMDDEWRLGVRQNNIVASVYHEAEGVPYDIQIDKLLWPADSKTDKDEMNPLDERNLAPPLSLSELSNKVISEDALRDFDLQQIPPMKVRLSDAYLGDQLLGSWQFNVYPLVDSLVVDEIQGGLSGFELVSSRAQSKSGQAGAKVRWFKNSQNEWMTKFEGKIKGENLSRLFNAMGQEALLETAQSSFDFHLLWPGSPVAWDYRLMQGEVDVSLTDGRFIQSAGAAGDAFLRLVSIFNFDSWARRLRLGLSDLYQDGMAFDRVNGRLLFGLGRIQMSHPMVAKTPSGELKLSGLIDLQNEQLDTKLVAVIPAGGNLAVLAGLAVGLPAAAGIYVVSKIFKRQVDKLASANYRVKGEWLSPKVRFIGLFDGEPSTQRERLRGTNNKAANALATHH